MNTSVASLVEESVHRDLPKSRQLRFAFAHVIHNKTVICHAIVERVRPVGVGTIFSDRDRCASRRIVSEARVGEHLERLDGVVQIWCSETLDGRQRDSSKGIQSDEVSIKFVLWWCADMGHPGRAETRVHTNNRIVR